MDEQNNDLNENAKQVEETNQPVQTDVTPQPEKKNGLLQNKWVKWVAPVLLVLLIAGGAFLMLNGDDEGTSEQVTQQNNNDSSQTQQDEQPAQSYRVVYWTFEGDEETPGRTYPTYKLWYQDSGSEPMQIAGLFGGSDDYLHIRQTQVTNDGKFVFLRYENKVERVNVGSGDKTTVATPDSGESILGISLSNDENSLLVASGTDNFEDQSTFLDEYSLSTLESQRIFNGDTPWGLVPLAQNEQGVWLVQHPRGTEGFFYGTFNPDSSTLSESDGRFLVSFSADGSALSYDATSESNVCDGFSGESPTAHSVINPFTGAETSTISRPGKHIRIKEFSRDGKNVLLLVKDIPELTEFDESVCNTYWDEDNGWDLVSTDVNDTSPKKVASAGEAYNIWYPNQPNPFVSQAGNTCTATLLDQKTVTSNCEDEVTVRILRTVQIN